MKAERNHPEIFENVFTENFIIIKKSLDMEIKTLYDNRVADFYSFFKNTAVIGLSPNGKATDSDSVISRFESL